MNTPGDKIYRYSFLLPLILLAVGLYVLFKANVVPASNSPKPSQLKDSAPNEVIAIIKVEGRADTTIIPCCGTVIEKNAETKVENSEVQSQPDEAYPYFLLASVIFIVLLVLPRLKELTISKDSVSVVLAEAEAGLDELQSLIQQEQVNDMREGKAGDVDNKVQRIKSKIQLAKKILARE